VVAFESSGANLSTEANDLYSNVFVRELQAPATAPTQADLSLTMTASNVAPTVGTNVMFTVIVANAGPAGATGIAVADRLPAGLTFLSATPSRGTYVANTGVWSVGSLAGGANASLGIVAKAATAGVQPNTAQVSAADQADPNSIPGNNNPAEDDQATVTVTVSAPPTCSSTTATADADSWIGQGSSSTNHGTETALKVRSKANDNARSLVHFTLPAIPTGCKLTSATLRLYASSGIPGRTLQAMALAGPWTETTVTWRNQPTTTGAAATAPSNSGWVDWTVTAQVSGMYSGANNGFLVRDANEGANGIVQNYASRETASDTRPGLIVNFRPA
jgi:uncharacterized repeat protein (TIGR01451 family)